MNPPPTLALPIGAASNSVSGRSHFTTGPIPRARPNFIESQRSTSFLKVEPLTRPRSCGATKEHCGL